MPANEADIDAHRPLLLDLARKYIWWQDPQEAVRNPRRVLAGAMNLGSLEDYHVMLKTFGEAALSDVLRNGVPGWFSVKSWSFWHRVLDLVDDSEPVPPLPERIFT